MFRKRLKNAGFGGKGSGEFEGYTGEMLRGSADPEEAEERAPVASRDLGGSGGDLGRLVARRAALVVRSPERGSSEGGGDFRSGTVTEIGPRGSGPCVLPSSFTVTKNERSFFW